MNNLLAVVAGAVAMFPLALVGSVVALWLSGQPLSVAAAVLFWCTRSCEMVTLTAL